MISEYHINLLLEKLKKIIENQNEILYELRELQSLRKPPVAQELPKENWSEPNKKSEEPAEVKEETATENKTETIPASFHRKEFLAYKRAGGKMGLKTWLKNGMPKEP